MKKSVTIASAFVAGMLFSNLGLASNAANSVTRFLKQPGNDKMKVYWSAGYKFGETTAGEIKDNAPTTHSLVRGSDNFASDIQSYDVVMSFKHFLFDAAVNHKDGNNHSTRLTVGTKTKFNGQTVRLFALVNKTRRQATFTTLGNNTLVFNGATAIAETDLHHNRKTQVGLSVSHQDGTATTPRFSAAADMIGVSLTHEFKFGKSTPSVFLNIQGMAGHSSDNPAISGANTLDNKTQGLSASVFTQKRLTNGLFACLRATYVNRSIAGIKLDNQSIRVSFGNACPRHLDDNNITYYS